ncbi:MAG: hypothetical protein ABW174_07195, partial [Flavitalea sp.]
MNKLSKIILMMAFFLKANAARSQDSIFLPKLLHEYASDALQKVLADPATYRYQLIYTRIDRDSNNKPQFTDYTYRLNKVEYFNPASMVKMPVAFLALEKLHRIKGVDKFTTMLTDSSYSRQSAVLSDTSSADGMPSVAQYIRKIFLVSDNDA